MAPRRTETCNEPRKWTESRRTHSPPAFFSSFVTCPLCEFTLLFLGILSLPTICGDPENEKPAESRRKGEVILSAPSVSSSSVVFNVNYQIELALLGLRYHFGSECSQLVHLVSYHNHDINRIALSFRGLKMQSRHCLSFFSLYLLMFSLSLNKQENSYLFFDVLLYHLHLAVFCHCSLTT